MSRVGHHADSAFDVVQTTSDIITLAHNGEGWLQDIPSLADILRAQNEFERSVVLPNRLLYNREAVYGFILELALRPEPTFSVKLKAWISEHDGHYASPYKANNSPLYDVQYRRTSPGSSTMRSGNVPDSSTHPFTAAALEVPYRARAQHHGEAVGWGPGDEVDLNIPVMRIRAERQVGAAGGEMGEGLEDDLQSPRTQRLVTHIRDWARESGSAVFANGKIPLDFDSVAYEDGKRKGRAFRQWVAFAVYSKQARAIEANVNEAQYAAARSQHHAVLLRQGFNSLVDACAASRCERQKLIVALEHWAMVTMRKMFSCWHSAVVIPTSTKSLQLAGHPVSIHALFRWIAQSLPEQSGGDAGDAASENGYFAQDNTGRLEAGALGSNLPAPDNGESRIRGYVVSRLRSATGRLCHLQRATAVLDVHILSAVFSAWKQEMEGFTACQSRMSELRASRALRLWEASSTLNRKLRIVAGRLMAQHRAKAFNTWVGYKRYRRVKHEAQNVADSQYSRQLGIRALRCIRSSVQIRTVSRAQNGVRMWRLTVTRIRKARKLMQLLRGNTTSSAFSQWKQALHVGSAECGQADIVATTLNLRCAWRGWRTALADRQRMRRAVSMLMNRHKGMAVRTWRQHAAELRDERAVMRRVIARMQHAKLAAAVRTWHENHAEQQQERGVIARVVMHMQNVKVGAALRTWQQHSSELRYERQLKVRVITQMRNVKLAAVVRTWQQNSAELRYDRELKARVIAKMQSAKIGAAVRTWQQHATELRYDRELKARVIAKMQSAKIGAAVRTWQQHATELRYDRELKARVIANMQSAKIGAAVRTWQQHASELRYERELKLKVVTTMRNVLLLRALRTWKDVKARHDRNLAIMRKNFQKWTNLSLVTCFSALRQNAASARKAVARGEEHYTVSAPHRLRRALRIFRDKIASVRGDQALMKRAIGRIMNRQAGAFLDEWAAWTQKRIRNREVLQRTVIRMQLALLARAFDAWTDYRNNQIQASEKLEAAVLKLANCKVFAALRTWRERAQTRVYNRGVLERTLLRMQNRLACAAMEAWRDALTGAKARRAIAEERFWRIQNKLMSSSLVALKGNRCERQADRGKLQRVEALITRIAPLRIAFQKYGSAAAAARREREMLAQAASAFMHRLQRQAFQAWVYMVSERKRIKQAAASVVDRIQHGKVRDAVAKWRLCSSSSRALATGSDQIAGLMQRFYDGAILLRVWAAWKRYTIRRLELDRLRAQLRIKSEHRWVSTALQTWLESWREAEFGRLQLRHLKHRGIRALRDEVARTHALETKALQLYSDSVLRRQSSCMRLWLQHVQTVRLMRDAVETMQGVHEEKRRRGAVQRWKEVVFETVQLRLATVKVDSAVRKLRANAALSRWLVWSRRHRKARLVMDKCVEALQRGLQRRVATAWHAAAQEITEDEHLGAIGKLHFASRVSRKALSTWIETASSGTKHRRAEAAVTALREEELRRFSWSLWRENAADSRLCRIAIAHASANARKHAVRLWLNHLLNVRIFVFVTRRKLRLHARAVRRWHDAARTARLASKVRTFRLHRAATKWLEWTRHRRNMRTRVHLLWSSNETEQKRKFFASWASATKEMRAYRREVIAQQEVELGLVRRKLTVKLNTMRYSFSEWKHRVAVTKRCRKIAASFLQASSFAPRVFNAWRSFAQERSRTRKSVAGLLRSFASNALRKCFEALRDSALEGRATRHASGALVGRVFRVWKVATATARIAAAQSLGTALLHHEKGLRRNIFSAWCKYAHRRALLHRLTGELQAEKVERRARTGLRLWALLGRRCAHARMVERRASELFSRQLQIRVFTAWAALTYTPGKHAQARLHGDRTPVPLIATRRSSISSTGSGGRASDREDFGALNWALRRGSNLDRSVGRPPTAPRSRV